MTAEGSSDKKGAVVEFARPDLFSVKNTAISNLRFSEEEPDGYKSSEIELSQRVERDFNEHYQGSAGITLERADVDDEGTRNIFTLLSLPLVLRRDTSNDLLNPTRGGRTTLAVSPYVEWFGAAPSFTVAQLYDATYLPLDSEGRYTIAIWGRGATLLGESTDDVPANKRLYSGGPGSVRAFALNRVGPLDATGDPIGGRSSTEAGIEARIRVYGDFAVVPFIEGGGVYDATFPRFGKDIQWGGGLGLRYHTVIGPVRLDLAFPFNRRQGDDAFQLLISLGQAF